MKKRRNRLLERIHSKGKKGKGTCPRENVRENSWKVQARRASVNLNRTYLRSNISASDKSKTSWLARLFKSSIPPSFQLFDSPLTPVGVPFPFRSANSLAWRDVPLTRQPPSRRRGYFNYWLFPAACETKARESRPWAFCPDNYEQLSRCGEGREIPDTGSFHVPEHGRMVSPFVILAR